MGKLRFEQCVKYFDDTCEILVEINNIFPIPTVVLTGDKEQQKVLNKCQPCQDFVRYSMNSGPIE